MLVIKDIQINKIFKKMCINLITVSLKILFISLTVYLKFYFLHNIKERESSLFDNIFKQSLYLSLYLFNNFLKRKCYGVGEISVQVSFHYYKFHKNIFYLQEGRQNL